MHHLPWRNHYHIRGGNTSKIECWDPKTSIRVLVLNAEEIALASQFNQQMRLQRQESLNDYMHMINHDAS